MSKALAIGHYMVFVPKTESNGYVRFQNFWVNQQVTFMGNPYSFLPFGFSGITINKKGDNIDAELIFPNNELSRPWSVVSIRNSWVCRVRTMVLDPSDPNAEPTLLYSYVGQISAGGWDPTTVSLRLNSVLDAVDSNIPRRVLDQKTVGYLPTTTQINV